jgi:hypothetical protein
LLIFWSVTFLIISVCIWIGISTYRFDRRWQFIGKAEYPASAMRELGRQHPKLSQRDLQLVADGLTQYFQVYLKSGFKFISMPSQIVDDLWHAFILDTRAYQAYCDKAFGRFLHHTPAVSMSAATKTNEGLRRVWWHTCKFEGIDPRKAMVLPLIFELDTRLLIPDGFRYTPDCEQLRAAGVVGAQCGGDFSSSSFDGGTAGFGDSGSGDGSSGGDGDGDGGGGGCGGD